MRWPDWKRRMAMLATAITVSLLASLGHAQNVKHELGERRHRDQQEVNTGQTDVPRWVHVLREFVFKTLSPPPPGNNNLYKQILQAPFYSGPFPDLSDATVDDPSVILSRGGVHRLANGQWILCQEGCTNCDVCQEQRHPTFQWTLRRIKRTSSHAPARHDIQLTILPQLDESFHIRSLWPASYIYVATPEELANAEMVLLPEDEHPFSLLPQFNDSRNHVERDTSWYRRGNMKSASGSTERKSGFHRNANRENVNHNHSEGYGPERNIEPRNNSRKRVLSSNLGWPMENNFNVLQGATENVEEDERSVPKLILGFDRLGGKHLVHVVPDSSPRSDNRSGIHELNRTIPPVTEALPIVEEHSTSKSEDEYRDDFPAYNQVSRKIADSLNAHRLSIEDFFGSRTNFSHFGRDLSFPVGEPTLLQPARVLPLLTTRRSRIGEPKNFDAERTPLDANRDKAVTSSWLSDMTNRRSEGRERANNVATGRANDFNWNVQRRRMARQKEESGDVTLAISHTPMASMRDLPAPEKNHFDFREPPGAHRGSQNMGRNRNRARLESIGQFSPNKRPTAVRRRVNGLANTYKFGDGTKPNVTLLTPHRR